MLGSQKIIKVLCQQGHKSVSPFLKGLSPFYYLTNKQFGRLVPVTLSDLGEGTKEAEIKKWHLKVGDTVDEEDKLVEVGTDKLLADIPSPVKGIVRKINFDISQICLVGKALCEIETEDGDENGDSTTVNLDIEIPFEKSKK